LLPRAIVCGVVGVVNNVEIGPQLYVDGKAHTTSVGSIDSYIL